MAANRLALEKSPYLLQHAENPVDWRPWGEEAFAEATRLDKPVFLSVGYSTCHWCHVMERESFEDEDTAAILNDAFVCIKVDREERPDVDSVYMTVCQLMTGRGGWPLTVVMTPDKRPFFAGTYFPPESGPGHIGLKDLARRIKELWRTERGKADATAASVVEHLHELERAHGAAPPVPEAMELAVEELRDTFDRKHGGFGSAPKFPSPHNLILLLRHHVRTGSESSLDMAATTLRAMRLGGLWDHVGHGFHRYSTDERWLLPHFEKMLYDQAMLTLAYAEGWQATGDALLRECAEQTMAYVLRDLRHPDGAFLCAEDADSEGEEGRFYVWRESELEETLGRADASLAKRVFNVQGAGNFRDEATGERTGTNILHLSATPDETARDLEMDPAVLRGRLESIRKRLFQARSRRVRPHLDDKVLTDWNGLMIGAMGRAARSIDASWTTPAARAADFVLSRLFDGKRLLHRFRDGEAAIRGTLSDYAFLAYGLTELYQAAFDPGYLRAAATLAETMAELFHDESSGGFFLTPADGEELIVRQKDAMDAALPSGNSMAALALVRLARLTGNTRFAALAQEAEGAASAHLSRRPSAFAWLLVALDELTADPVVVTVAGHKDRPDTETMLAAARAPYLPGRVVLFRPEGDASVCDIAPFTRSQTMQDNKATAYACFGKACREPVTDPAALEELLRRAAGA